MFLEKGRLYINQHENIFLKVLDFPKILWYNITRKRRSPPVKINYNKSWGTLNPER